MSDVQTMVLLAVIFLVVSGITAMQEKMQDKKHTEYEQGEY